MDAIAESKTGMKAGVEARRFRAEAVVKPHNAGVWGSALVNIFDGDVQIGHYERNHPGWAQETFEPFEANGMWYALYCRDYTSTRLMSLPACEDLGGEEPALHGFCPVELYVPRYRKVSRRNRSNGRETESWLFETNAIDPTIADNVDHSYDSTFGPWQSLTTGFVAGCLWGDDSSWKLEVFDLSNAGAGQITRSARFGHLQLAGGMSLPDSLQFDSHLPDWELRATIVRQERRDVASGQLIDPYDE